MSTQIKGWCPSAHRPMMSGDGLLVRIHPRKARLTAQETHALCDAALAYGNGMIDVTSRANLQIRGVSEAGYPALLERLIEVGLVDPDPAKEAAHSITVTPFWHLGDLTDRLATVLGATQRLDLPDKMGIVVDAGLAPMLTTVSGDFRFETDETGGLVLRADGAIAGWSISESDAPAALVEMAEWFLKTGGAEKGRMARHLRETDLPPEWQTNPPVVGGGPPTPGAAHDGHLYGVPFGQTDAIALKDLMNKTGASHIRLTPWRMLYLEDAAKVDVPGFLSAPDPLLDVYACPGAPACAQASVATRDLARLLVPKIKGRLHVSGCAKGCARRTPTAITLVGRNGRFDLVQDGTPADTPIKTGLTQAEVLEHFA